MFIASYRWTFAAGLLLATLAGAAEAAELPSSARGRGESRAKLLAPFIDDQTIGVAHVDMSRIDIDKLFEFGREFWFGTHPLVKSQEAARKFADAFKEAGGRDLYVVASLADLPEREPFFLVPLGKDSNEEKLKAALAAFETQERIGDVLFAGSRTTRQRLQQSQPKTRPELQRALEAAGDSQLQFVFMPSASTRRVVEELMPTLPASVGGGPTRTVTRGTMWVAITLNGPPEIDARLIIQGQDVPSASMLRGLWREMLARAWPEGAKVSERITPELHDDRLVLQLKRETIEAISSIVRPQLGAVTDFARRQQSVEHLKQLGLAMHNYADANKHFPPAALTAPDGKPLLSWRVAILPYLDQGALYKEFRLDEAWDSPHNRKLINRMPDAFKSLSVAASENRTPYVVPVGKGSAFERATDISIAEITDGTSNTIMAIEVADEQAVIWTKPDDYSYDPTQPAVGLTTPYPNGRLFLFCDGSVHFSTQPLDDEVLRRLLTRNDGQVVPDLR